MKLYTNIDFLALFFSQELKIIFGDDVAIELCKTLIIDTDCETIVRVYISYGGGINPIPSHPSRLTKGEIFVINALPSFNKFILELYEVDYIKTTTFIYIIIKYYNTLIKEMTKREILELIKTIFSR